jgi:serine/threonine protein kinase
MEENIFGNYVIIEKIATAGMAEIFLAKRRGIEGFEKLVVIKKILSHLSSDKEFIDMFIDEAKIAAQLSHPNIIYIEELGKIGESYYIAMEYVSGKNLAQILNIYRRLNKNIPLDITLYITTKICSALDYAHKKKDKDGREMKIIHRDVSPSNILISEEGEVKLTDFGIARATSQIHITDIRLLKGKISYMSPEQAQGKEVDKRIDIYALGIVFYEMLTNHRVFEGKTDLETLEKVKEGKVLPPRKFNPQIPLEIERIVLKALQKSVNKRYQNAYLMWHDLEKFIYQHHLNRTNVDLANFMEMLPMLEKEAIELKVKTEKPTEEEKPTKKEVKEPISAKEGEEVSFQKIATELSPTEKLIAEEKEKQVKAIPPVTPSWARVEVSSKHTARFFSLFFIGLLLVGALFAFFKLRKPPSQKVETVKETVAYLKITSSPSGAKVILNGGEYENQEIGTTPCELKEISLAKYKLKVLKEKFNPYQTEIDLFLTPQKEIAVSLEREIKISSRPTETQILISPSQQKGVAPDKFTLWFGQNEIKVEKAGYLPFLFSLEVKEDGEIDFIDRSPHVQIVSQNPFHLHFLLAKPVDIHSQPPEVEIKIDGKKVGKTPLHQHPLLLGKTYTFVFEKKGFRKKIKKLTIQETTSPNIRVVLKKVEKISGPVVKKREPQLEERPVFRLPRVKVTVSDKETGKVLRDCKIKLVDRRNFTGDTNIIFLIPSQQEKEVAVGDYILFVEKKGYELFTQRNISLKENDEKVIEVELIPVKGEIMVRTFPQDANVYLDEVFLGQGMVIKRDIPAGKYQLKVTHPSFNQPKIMTIEIGRKKRKYKVMMKEGELVLKGK